MNHLHRAHFVQGSFYQRNVLVQPGPLRLPPAERSLDDPSFRIIDFGRGMCPSVNCSLDDFSEEVSDEQERVRNLFQRR